MIRRGRIHRIPAFAGLLALSLGSAVVTAAPAHASTAGINCTGWSYTTYAPGLTDTVRPTTVVVDGDLNVIDAHSPTGSCLSANSTATAGERDVTAQLDLSCNQLIGESGVETIRWNNGTTSSFPFTAAVVRGLSTTVLTETGTVTSGEFAGGHVVETFTAANLDLLGCLIPGGVTSLNFATVLTITPA